jgi:hypothetical protein
VQVQSVATARPTATAPAATRGSKAHRRELRPVVARFHVAQPGRIRVRILELAPLCRSRGDFVFKAQRGKNTLRLPKRITTLGTYLLTGHRGEHEVFMFRARLLAGRHVKLGGGENVCLAHIDAALASLHVLPASKHQIFKPPPQLQSRTRVSAAPKAIAGSPRNTSPLVRAVTLHDAPPPLRPLLLALLAMSIGLLAVAALPQRLLPAGPAAALIARRRVYIAAAGIWLFALVAVVTTFA